MQSEHKQIGEKASCNLSHYDSLLLFSVSISFYCRGALYCCQQASGVIKSPTRDIKLPGNGERERAGRERDREREIHSTDSLYKQVLHLCDNQHKNLVNFYLSDQLVLKRKGHRIELER